MSITVLRALKFYYTVAMHHVYAEMLGNGRNKFFSYV